MLRALDEHVFHLIYGRTHPALTAVMLAFSLLGSGWAMLALVPLLAQARARRFAAWLTATLSITALVVFVLKAAVGRDRPFLVFTKIERLALDSPTDHSFPSGHAAGSFAFALFVSVVVLGLRRRHAVTTSALLVTFASCVAVSRVVLGFHFPGDVLAGELIGAAAGALGARLYLWQRSKFS
jgi:undecaprenyl-diphosphatase